MAVQTELQNDDIIGEQEINVETKSGVVLLSGNATNIISVERATRIAESIRGVLSVVNRIVLDVPDRDDAAIKNDVDAALKNEPATDGFEVDVRVKNQVVTLSGRVQSWDEKQICQWLAESTKGVSEVQNNLDIVYVENRSDYAIQQSVKTRLDWDTLIDDELIRVHVRDGEVSLVGTAGSAAERRRAMMKSWVTGVTSVSVDDLEVSWVAADPDKKTRIHVRRTDDEIEKVLATAFMYDPNTKALDIRTQVENGQVTLGGYAATLKAKSAAEQVALATAGVKSVVNHIQISQRPPIQDDQLETIVRNEILRSPISAVKSLSVDVSDGIATIGGEVKNSATHSEVVRQASNVRGIKQIQSKMKVKNKDISFISNQIIYPYQPYVNPLVVYEGMKVKKDDKAIQKDIESELYWSPFVDSEDISVSVNEGHATLKGTVDSNTERQAAIENALEGGAVKAIDQLRYRDM